MDVEDFEIKYNVAQLGDISDITFNIQALGEMLREHSLDEFQKIIEEMCNVE